MSKKNKRSQLSIGGAFTPLLVAMQDSDAYRDLSGNAAKLLGFFIRTARAVAVKTGAGNECLVNFDYTYSEGKKRGFSESTFKRAVKEIWANGFINVIVIGGRTASNERGRMSSRYQLAGYWQSYGKQWKDRTQIGPDPWSKVSEPKKQEAERW